MYACERCGARFHSARAASLEFCPRCLLRDDAASPLHWAPPHTDQERRQERDSETREGPTGQDETR
jgi:predicted  nucleic acid-binding Zn-ribbon protein